MQSQIKFERNLSGAGFRSALSAAGDLMDNLAGVVAKLPPTPLRRQRTGEFRRLGAGLRELATLPKLPVAEFVTAYDFLSRADHVAMAFQETARGSRRNDIVAVRFAADYYKNLWRRSVSRDTINRLREQCWTIRLPD